jgi:hypothetical protein
MSSFEAYVSYVKKKINAYMKDNSFEIPSVDAKARVSRTAVSDVVRDFGFRSEYLNCSLNHQQAMNDLRVIQNEIANNRDKKIVVFFNHYDESGNDRLLMRRVDDYISQQKLNNNVKIILGKALGDSDAVSQDGNTTSKTISCVCDGFILLHHGCTCKRKGRKY